MKRLFFILFCLIPRIALAAVTVDTTSISAHNVTTESFSHTITGTNTLLLCTVSGTNNRSIVSYTYDGTAMALVARADNVDSGNRYVAIYKLATGTGSGTAKTAEVNLSAIEAVIATCTSFTGVDQTTPTGTAATSYNSTGSAMPATSITIPANGLGFDVGMASMDSGCTDQTPGGSQTQLHDSCDIDEASNSFGSVISATGSQSFTWTINVAGSNYWAQVAVPINGVTTGGGGVARRRIIVTE